MPAPVKNAVLPLGASLAGWPWWAIAVLLVISCGASWVMAWLDVLDRIQRRRSEAGVPDNLTP